LSHFRIIRYNRTQVATQNFPGNWAASALIDDAGALGHLGMPLVLSELLMQYLNSRLFWDKKVKIALLALATFIAMC